MSVHRLKIWREPFMAMRLGLKRFEYRAEAPQKPGDHPRHFEVGDLLCLEEFDQVHELETGNGLWQVVTFVLRGPDFGVPVGFAVLSVASLYDAERRGVAVDAVDLDHMRSYERNLSGIGRKR